MFEPIKLFVDNLMSHPDEVYSYAKWCLQDFLADAGMIVLFWGLLYFAFFVFHIVT